MTASLDRALEAFRQSGAPDGVVLAALEEAERLLEEERALAAMEVLARAEAELGAGFGGVRGGELGLSHVERPRVHAWLRLRERIDQLLPSIRRAVRFPEELRRALELEVERAMALSNAFVKLGWYAHAATTLAGAELPLGYLGPHPRHRFEFLRTRAGWAFAARQIGEARRTVREYHALLRSVSPPEGEVERLIEDLDGWLDVAPVRALVADLGPLVAGDPRLEGRLRTWDLAWRLVLPWDQAFEAELEARLRTPTVALLEAFIDRVGESLSARAATWLDHSLDQVLRPALLEDVGRVLLLLDRLAFLAEQSGEAPLALRARVIAHEQMLDLLAAVREEALVEVHPADSARVRKILAEPPWSEQARRDRLAALLRAAGDAPEARVVAVIVADPMLPPDDAIALARRVLVGEADEAKLDVAAALVDRGALQGPSARESERATMSFGRTWLEEACQVRDSAIAMEAKELLAGACELGGDDAAALRLYEELAQYFEARDHERWVRAVERCAMLAKRTGTLSAAGRAARSGFRPGGRVQLPADDLPDPDEPLQAEEQAERAIAVALRTQDPEVGEAWLRRALALYEKVPDGRRREDEIWERIADLWQAEADALFESGDASSQQVDEAHRRAHEALVRAIDVNKELGDGQRVFELSGRVLDVLWTWVTRWEDAAHAFLALTRERFRSAVARGDLEHAATALFELRAHAADLRSDVSDLGPEDEGARGLLARIEELEKEMAATMAVETERLGEPWWLERVERRAELLERRFAQRQDSER
jgi:hypothetical protein